MLSAIIAPLSNTLQKNVEWFFQENMLNVKLSRWLEAGYCQPTLTVMAAYIKHNKYKYVIYGVGGWYKGKNCTQGLEYSL